MRLFIPLQTKLAYRVSEILFLSPLSHPIFDRKPNPLEPDHDPPAEEATSFPTKHWMVVEIVLPQGDEMLLLAR
jgi:hypothetical protein